MTAKKKILIGLSAIVAVAAIVAASVAGTVAYLAASSSVTNVFTVGNIAIHMDESAVNPDGTLLDGGATRRDTNTYNLVPDGEYVKDPTIHVQEGSEAAYLFITVKNDIAPIAADDVDKPTIAEQLETNGWAKIAQVPAGNVYVYVGAGNVAAGGELDINSPKSAVEFSQGGQSYLLFEKFYIGHDVDCTPYGAAKIIINGFAIQDTGLETVKDAWEAIVAKFDYLNLTEGGGSGL